MANEYKGLINQTTGQEINDANANGMFSLSTDDVSNVPDIANLRTINTDTLFPGGVVDKTETTITFDDTNRRLSISLTGSEFNFYERGIKYTKTTTDTFDIADTEGIHTVFYSDGSLTEYINPTPTQFEQIVFDKAFIAIILWNATDKEGLLFDERHGCQMSAQSHYYDHNSFGCQYWTGLDIGDVNLDQSGDLDTDAQFSISAGVVSDEDIIHDIVDMAVGDTYTVLWKNTSGYWRWSKKTGFAVLTTGSGRLAYNNAGTITEVSNNSFVLYHMFGSSVIVNTGTGWEKQPLVFMGTSQYGNVSAARDSSDSEIAALDLTGFAYERKALYSFIFQTGTGMTNAVKAALRSIDGASSPAVDFRVNPLNQRLASTLYHEALLNRNTGDQHTQYVYLVGRGGQIVLDYVKTDGIFAEIYVSDGSTAQTIPTGSTYTKITAFTNNGESSNMTADASNDKITATLTGRYILNGSFSFYSDTPNVLWEGVLFVGGIEVSKIHFSRYASTGSDIIGASFAGIIDITTISTDIDVRFRHDNGLSINLIVIAANLTLTFAGNT